jgi:ATP-dependent Clp protease ATP-binding subunit ClpA
MLARDFLAQMARECELSKEQQEVFLLRYGEELSYEQIAERLKTSQGACLKRMGQVYNKFKVSGNSRGKETRLRNSLIKQFQQIAPQETSPLQLLQPGKNKQRTGSPTPLLQAEESNNSSLPTLVANVKGSGLSTNIYENLPRRECTTFIGRRQELARLLQLLSFEKAANLISVDGVGGVGKTTLVLEAAHMSLQVSMMQPGSGQQTFEGTAIPSFEAIIFTSAKKQYLKALQILPRLKREHNLRDSMQDVR